MNTGWPARLWLVRHGESAGNVARTAAEKSGAATIAVEGRDMDVPLSALGERQARAVGTWFAAQPIEHRPTVVMSSPYARAWQTTRCLMEEAKLAPNVRSIADERLREKEFGALNRLTRSGIEAALPAEARLREELGKFYYRPPGGERWCDAILRLRSVFDQLQLRQAGERVLIVSHQVVVLCFRYLIEELDEARLLAIDAAGDVANCAITSYEASRQGERERLTLRQYNFVAPLEEAGEQVTADPDPAVNK